MSISAHSSETEPISHLGVDGNSQVFANDVQTIASHSEDSGSFHLTDFTDVSVFDLGIKLVGIVEVHIVHEDAVETVID